MAIVPKAVGQCNPFGAASRGACVPDGLGTNCCPMQFRGHVNFAINQASSTACLAVVVPQLPYPYVAGTFSSPNYTIGAAFGAMSDFQNNVVDLDQYRIVSWGLVVRCTSSCNNSQGLLTMNEQDDEFSNTALGSTFAAGSMTAAASRVFPLVAGGEYWFVGRPIGMDSASFSVPMANTSTPSSGGFTSCTIEVSGASSSTTIDIEVVINVEARYNRKSPMALVAPPTMPPNPLLQRMRTTVYNAMERIGEGAVGAIENKVAQVVSSHLARKAPMMLLDASESYAMG